MRWLLAGCCGLALISLSAALHITQKPRYYGIKTGRYVDVVCSISPAEKASVRWYRADTYDKKSEERMEVKGKMVSSDDKEKIQNAYLYISKVKIEDSGVYFCLVNNKTWGPGSEIRVVRPINITNALHHSRMKDGLMIFQGLLLAVTIAAMMLRNQTLSENNDSSYEEPETDHIYQGLAIETYGGGLYEELSVYAQAEGTEGAEAPWEKERPQ